MNDAAVLAIQGVVVALISAAGTVIVGRLTKRAQNEQTEVNSQARATEAWQEYATKMEERLDRVENRLQTVQEQSDEDRRRIQRLERQRENDRDLIRSLVHRLRWAFAEIRNLGGTVPAHYDGLADRAEIRIEADR